MIFILSLLSLVAQMSRNIKKGGQTIPRSSLIV